MQPEKLNFEKIVTQTHSTQKASGATSRQVWVNDEIWEFAKAYTESEFNRARPLEFDPTNGEHVLLGERLTMPDVLLNLVLRGIAKHRKSPLTFTRFFKRPNALQQKAELHQFVVFIPKNVAKEITAIWEANKGQKKRGNPKSVGMVTKLDVLTTLMQNGFESLKASGKI